MPTASRNRAQPPDLDSLVAARRAVRMRDERIKAGDAGEINPFFLPSLVSAQHYLPNPLVVEQNILGVFEHGPEIMDPPQLTAAYMAWRRSRAYCGWTVLDRKKVELASALCLQALAHRVVEVRFDPSGGVPRFLISPDRPCWEYATVHGVRVARPTHWLHQTPEGLAAIRARHARLARLHVTLDAKHAAAVRPRIRQRLADVLARHGDIYVPEAWITRGETEAFVPELFDGRPLATAIEALAELHVSWTRERQKAWLKALSEAYWQDQRPVGAEDTNAPAEDLEALRELV